MSNSVDPDCLTASWNNTTSSNFMQVHLFKVHLQSLPGRADRLSFASFLQHGHLLMDVYDGDSLILLGVVHVPLTVSVLLVIDAI